MGFSEIVKAKAQSTHDKPRSIIRETQSGLNGGEAVAATRPAPLRQLINRLRRKTNKFESDPLSRENIQLPFDILTKKGEQFLWDDSGVDDKNRIIIFSRMLLFVANSEFPMCSH